MDLLETLRHETIQSLARRSDLERLEQQLSTHIRRAGAGLRRDRARQGADTDRLAGPCHQYSRPVLSVAGLGKMILLVSLSGFDVFVTSGGALLTFWGTARFNSKRREELDLGRRYAHAWLRQQHLNEALVRVRRARQRQLRSG